MTETVTVASKLPHGLKCRIMRFREVQELVMGGGSRTVNVAYETGEIFVINGVAREAGSMPLARLPSGAPDPEHYVQMTDTGYGLTSGVPKDLWDTWLAQNRDLDLVRNELVFAHKQGASVKAQAKTNEKRRSGLEPLDPDNPGGGVEMTDEQKKVRLKA